MFMRPVLSQTPVRCIEHKPNIGIRSYPVVVYKVIRTDPHDSIVGLIDVPPDVIPENMNRAQKYTRQRFTIRLPLSFYRVKLKYPFKRGAGLSPTKTSVVLLLLSSTPRLHPCTVAVFYVKKLDTIRALHNMDNQLERPKLKNRAKLPDYGFGSSCEIPMYQESTLPRVKIIP